MAGMFHAIPEALGAFGHRVTDDFGQRASGIQDNTRSAEVPAVSWGLIGQPVAWTAYRSLLEEFVDHIGKVGDNAREAGERLCETAERYRAADQAGKDLMDRIAQQLGWASGGRPPMPGGGQ